MNLVKAILEKQYVQAGQVIKEKLDALKARRLLEAKKAVNAETVNLDETEEVEITRELVMEAPRVRIVRARIRNGKVQRRKRVANVAGYTMRKKGAGPARLIRMTPTERRKRKMGQRRGKIKRRAKLSKFRMKLKRSMIKRKALGLKTK